MPSSRVAHLTARVEPGKTISAPTREEIEIPSLPLTPTQRGYFGPGGSALGRHWAQAVWPEFSERRFHEAVRRASARHPHARATRDGACQCFASTPPLGERLVQVEDGSGLDAEHRRERVSTAIAHLAASGTGEDAPSWQAHVMQMNTGAAVVTLAFVRAFFDRPTIERFLGDLVACYHDGGEPAPRAPQGLESFAAWVDLRAGAADSRPECAALPGPDILSHPEAATPGGPAWRISIRLDASAWAAFRANLATVAPAASRDAALGACAARVLGLWSSRPTFTVMASRDGRAELPAPADAPGQFELHHAITVDESSPCTLQEAACAFQESLDTKPGPAAVASPAVLISFQAAPSPAPTDFSSERFVFIGSSHPQVSLEMHAEETIDGALVIHLDHAAGRFDPGRVEEIASALDLTLHRAAAGLDGWRQIQAADAWDTLPADQRLRRLMVNATHAPVADGLLFSGFLRQVSAAHGRRAVTSTARHLTYGELYGFACRLALELQERGVRPNELVAIVAAKGWQQVAAALGIVMAGGAYLPVDPDQPAERIRHLVTSGEARLAITTADALAQAIPLDGVELLAIDALDPVPLETPPPECPARPTDLAYVIFTSGSTGTPKGVMIEHRGALNTIDDMNSRFGVTADDRILALSRLSFDLSVYDIFGVLAAGGTIVLPSSEGARDPAHWLDLVREHEVTLWNTVPALMQLFLDHLAELRKSRAGRIRHVWLSGDWIPLNLPEAIHAVWPEAVVTSLGGATEASIWSILFPITQVEPAWRSIPYGRPMRNQTFHVLHPNLAPCPDGVSGELYIGGIGLARGYWKDPERTAARFPVHPHSGERLYRTGDLGRYRPDGDIEFLGRADFQVKIRGFRIEPGEIEAALSTHPQVRAAVVVAHGQDDHTRRLIAHVAGPSLGTDIAEALREFLRARLPEYMVPAHIVFHRQLPLTANGKIDHKALPVPGAIRAAAGPTPAAAGNEIEALVLQLWRALLGVEDLGIDDDFFAVGGTSLTGTRVVMRLRSALSIPLPVQCLVEHPTVRRLARVIEDRLLEDLAEDPAAPTGEPTSRR